MLNGFTKARKIHLKTVDNPTTYSSFKKRLSVGWSLEDAINTPNLGQGGSINRKKEYEEAL